MSDDKIKFDPKKNTIWLDMDGVLAAFDKYVIDNYGKSYLDSMNDAEMWKMLYSVDHLYLMLEPTYYAKELYELAKSITDNVKVLTAIPRRTSIPHAEQDKREWIKTHISDTLPVEIGPYSRDKFKHCVPGDILIDDRPSNIEEWKNAGGIPIYHTTDTWEDTKEILNILKRIVSE